MASNIFEMMKHVHACACASRNVVNTRACARTRTVPIAYDSESQTPSRSRHVRHVHAYVHFRFRIFSAPSLALRAHRCLRGACRRGGGRSRSDSSAHPGTRHCPWGAELASKTPNRTEQNMCRTWFQEEHAAASLSYATPRWRPQGCSHRCVHGLRATKMPRW